MPAIKSLEDLKRVREEALEKRKLKATEGKTQVAVAMGTCGIAVGARDAMKAILDVIEKDNLRDIIVSQTGCIGLCEKEPLVQVTVGEQSKVTYGKVTPEIARRIIKEHVVGGKIVENHVIQM
jgi:NADP-reducing hydrogenase subunit HndB